MQVGTVASLWRYPVKSMAGERREHATVTWRGIPGDRGWAVFDDVRGGVTNAKRVPPLRRLRARYLEEPASGASSPPILITLPDGSTVRSSDADAAQRLSGAVGRAVSLRALGPAGTEAAPRLTLDDEPEDYVRELMGLEPGEPMPDFSEYPPERLRLLRQGNFFDAMPIHLITRTTLSTLAGIAPDSKWDERRFRPNVVVEATSAEGYPELGWVGRRVRIGTAVIEVASGCPRCVMATLAVDELTHDPRVMRTLVRETAHNAGIYAGVVEPGEVAIGDPVTLT